MVIHEDIEIHTHYTKDCKENIRILLTAISFLLGLWVFLRLLYFLKFP